MTPLVPDHLTARTLAVRLLLLHTPHLACPPSPSTAAHPNPNPNPDPTPTRTLTPTPTLTPGSIVVAAAYLFFNYRRNRLDLAAQIEHNLQHLLRRGRSSHLHPIIRFNSRSRCA